MQELTKTITAPGEPKKAWQITVTMPDGMILTYHLHSWEQRGNRILFIDPKSGKAKLKEGQAHRKEQGIYYTPTYIVDYIVRNTLLETLKNKKANQKDIKVLDIACGSGSFLIKAFDYLHGSFSQRDDSKQYKLDSQGAYSIKTAILKKNVFGVDLDNKAVEITKLNLLLKAAEKQTTSTN